MYSLGRGHVRDTTTPGHAAGARGYLTAAPPQMLLLTTPGADPSAELADYAATAVGREKFHEIAMGQGQADRALTMLRECARNGAAPPPRGTRGEQGRGASMLEPCG